MFALEYALLHDVSVSIGKVALSGSPFSIQSIQHMAVIPTQPFVWVDDEPASARAVFTVVSSDSYVSGNTHRECRQ